MILAVFIIVLILILPIILSMYGCYCVSQKRFYFAIYLFGFIKIFSGYVKSRAKGGFYIHLSENKAIIIDYNTIKKLSGGPNYFSKIQLKSLYVILDSGIKNINLLFFIYSVMSAIKNYAVISTNSGKITKIKTDINVYNTQETIKYIKIKAVLMLNLICILQSIIANAKVVGEKYVKRKKKQFKRIYS